MLDQVVIAIPVRDEAERIAACLRALACQPEAIDCRVLLLLNNCTDGTADIVRHLRPSLPMRVILDDRPGSADLASAGQARRLAMEAGAAMLPDDGILLTTDADSCVAPDWIAANLAYIRDGMDAVMGRAIIDPIEASLIPQHLHDDDALECAYAALLTQMQCVFDPEPGDPWPRHDEHSGASIAVTRAAYRKAGGMPGVMLGEDRAFHDALRLVDARIRHAPDVSVTVSGRLHGRAAGGMADTMRRRMVQADPFLDACLEPADNAACRARLRARCRVLWTARDAGDMRIAALATALALPVGAVAEALRAPFFGAAWAALEAQTARLVRIAVPVRELAAETARAHAILRLSDAANDPTGIPACVPAAMA